MKVLVLGGSGYIGSRLCNLLHDSDWAQPVSASRSPTAGASQLQRLHHLQVDTRDTAALAAGLRGFDAVVNCVAGNAGAIAQGAKGLVQAALASGCQRIIHLSSMSVYGAIEGDVTEQSEAGPSLGWYGRAKCEAERHIAGFADAGGKAVVLRPGCVWGPGSELWVGRIGRWLRAGRLGDLGVAGDGWSNLVHVDDVCRAIGSALRDRSPPGEVRTFNLAAGDSPRWNQYFIDLALAIGATPVRRISPGRLKLDAWLAGPPLKLTQRALTSLGRSARHAPDPMPPGVLKLWQRQLRLNATSARLKLQIECASYSVGLQQSAAWFLQNQQHALQDQQLRA